MLSPTARGLLGLGTLSGDSALTAADFDNPTALYLPSSASGDTWADLSGNGHDLTLVGSPTITADGVTFNGTDQTATLAHTTAVEPESGDFSALVVCNPADLDTNFERLIDKRSSGVGWSMWSTGSGQGLQAFVDNTSQSANGPGEGSDQYALYRITSATLTLRVNGTTTAGISVSGSQPVTQPSAPLAIASLGGSAFFLPVTVYGMAIWKGTAISDGDADTYVGLMRSGIV